MVSSCCFVNFIFCCIVQKKLTFIVVVMASVVRTQKLMVPVLWDFFLNREVKFKKGAFLKTPSNVWTRSKSLFVSLLFVCLCCRLRFNLK